MEQTHKNKYTNLLLLSGAALISFFSPLLGVGLFTYLLLNTSNSRIALSKEEKTMAIIALVIVAVYALVNTIFTMQNMQNEPSEDTISALLALIFI